MKAQVALDRISAELRNIKASPKPVFETRKITYQNDIAAGTGSCKSKTASRDQEYTRTVGGAKNLLLDNVNLDNVIVPKSDISYETSKNLDNRKQQQRNQRHPGHVAAD